MPDVTRIIEQTASETIYNDDWLVKDSVNQGTTKIQPSVLKAWINDGMATVEELEIVVGNIADTYNTSESYVVDDLCIHEYALYKCIGATTGTWDSTKWQATTIAEIIATIDLSAEAISYDNTSSGLEAENVQDAIGETITKLSAVGSASGAIATFDDGANLPMPNLIVGIEPVQSGSGDPSPTNIRPISGWDEANVTRCGKNLWGGEKFADDIVAKVPNATKDTTNHTVTYSASNIAEKILFRNFKENTQYSIFIDLVSGTRTNLRVVYKDGTNQGISGNIYPFITQANKSVDYIIGIWAGGSTTINYLTSGLFEGVITAQDFEAYNGSTYTIDLDGTRYGGTLDVISGALTVDVPDTLKIKLSSLNWTYQETQRRFYAAAPTGIQKPATNNDLPKYFMCECYRAHSYLGSQNGDIAITMTGSIFVIDSNYTDVTTWLNAVGDNYLLLTLETPLTIQLTPTQVKSLPEVNNIWADTGDILDAEYIRDMTTIINSLIARIEALENQ